VYIKDHSLVLLRDCGNADRALGTDDLGLNMIAVRSGTANVNEAHCTVFELVASHSGLVVANLLEFRMLEGAALCVNLGCLAAQEPAHQVDVMDCHVEEDTAGGCSKLDCALNVCFGVDAGCLNHVGSADCALFDLLLCVSVGLVVAAHKAQHKGQVGMTLNSLLSLLALCNVNAQRLVGEYMLASVQSGLDLPAVLGRSGDDCNCVDVSLFQHLTEIGVNIGDTQLFLCVFQLSRNDGASCGQLSVRNLVCDIVCVYLAQTAKTCDTNLNLLHIFMTSSEKIQG